MFNFKKEYIIKTTKKNGEVQEIRRKIHFFGFGKAPNMDEYINDDEIDNKLCDSSETNSETEDYMENIFHHARNIIKNNLINQNESDINDMPHIRPMNPKYVVKPCKLFQTKLRGKNVAVIVEKDNITILDKNNPNGPVVSRLRLKFDDI